MKKFVAIILAVLLAIVASLWIKSLQLGNFVTLLVSAALFFGIYGCFLLFRKEELIVEICSGITKQLKRKK